MSDTFDLNRFVTAQASPWSGYAQALKEIRQGQKTSHWIWYIFPQIRGLSRNPSSVNQFYAISCLEEARAYLAHPSLNRNLREISAALLELHSNDPMEVMNGWIDAKKLRSSMTLFAQATEDNRVFLSVLEKFFGGSQDKHTLKILTQQGA